MARELLLLRHAKSDWDSSSDDFERPLNTRGQRDAPRIGQWLREHKLMPGCVVSSPARRAAQTAQAVCEALGYPPDRIVWDKRLYLASRETLLGVLAEQIKKHHCLMLIGHNPGLEQLLEYLAEDAPTRQPNGKLLTTATLAHLRLAAPSPIAQGGRLLNLVRPRDLSGSAHKA